MSSHKQADMPYFPIDVLLSANITRNLGYKDNCIRPRFLKIFLSPKKTISSTFLLHIREKMHSSTLSYRLFASFLKRKNITPYKSFSKKTLHLSVSDITVSQKGTYRLKHHPVIFQPMFQSGT